MVDATVDVYTWCCHAKCLATLQEVRCKPVKTTRSVSEEKLSIFTAENTCLGIVGFALLDAQFLFLQESLEKYLNQFALMGRDTSRKQPNSKKMCLLWNEGQVHLWKVQCRVSHWLFFCISRQTVMCLHINKPLCTCFMYITRSKTNKKLWIIVHWMCYLAFPLPTKNLKIIETPTHSCKASQIWDANYFR